MKCQNCLQNLDAVTYEGLPDVCIAEALINIAVDSRESIIEEEAEKLLNQLDVDRFWYDIGPIIDRLESGYYNEPPTRQLQRLHDRTN